MTKKSRIIALLGIVLLECLLSKHQAFNGVPPLVAPVEMLVDASRDGKMSFTDPAIHDMDQTTKDNPFTFWINNDYDKGATVDGNDWEQDDYDVTKDSNDELVEWRRDLEDLTRLWVSFKGLTEMLKQTGIEVKFEMKPMEGETSTPAAVRIFPAYEKQDGGNKYLFDDATAWEQVDHESHLGIWGRAFGKAGQGQSCPLPTTDSYPVWTKPSEESPYRYFLFEGVSKGKGQLVLTIYKDGLKIAECPPVYLELKETKDMFEHWSVGSSPSAGIDYSLHPAASANLLRALPDPTTDEERDYVLFVHGWNMRPDDMTSYPETAFKRLWHQGYKGQFGYFEWPAFYKGRLPGEDAYLGMPMVSPGTGWTVINKDNFDASEKNAWESGVGLLDCIQKLNAKHSGRVRVLAHSQGNVVVAEALRSANHTQVVHSYIASQAALTADCYDRNATDMARVILFGYQSTHDIYSRAWKTGAPLLPENWTDAQPSYLAPDYMSGAAGKYVNFYNPFDYGLNDIVWQLDQQLKSNDTFSYVWPEGFIKYEGSFPQHRILAFPNEVI